MKTIKEIEKEFEKEFTFEGDWGEKKFSHFIATNRRRTDPIIPEEDELTVALKSFLRTQITELLEGLKMEEKIWKPSGRIELQIGDKIFIDGYNNAVREINNKIDKAKS